MVPGTRHTQFCGGVPRITLSQSLNRIHNWSRAPWVCTHTEQNKPARLLVYIFVPGQQRMYDQYFEVLRSTPTWNMYIPLQVYVLQVR